MKYLHLLIFCTLFSQSLLALDPTLQVPSTKLQALEPFDFRQIMHAPGATKRQFAANHFRLFVLFSATKKPYEDSVEAMAFVKQNFSQAKALESDAAVMRAASGAVSIKNGYYLEMGVSSGRTTNF